MHFVPSNGVLHVVYWHDGCCNLLHPACLNDVEVIDVASFTYSGIAQDFERKNFGYKIHFPDSALPPEVDECQVHVESSLCGQFQFPENTELISGVYWITTDQEFTKPVTVEFQHCAKPQHVENLTFVVAKHTPEDLPYKFNIVDGGLFSLGTQYGSICLTHFCGFGIGHQSSHRPSLMQRLCCRAYQLLESHNVTSYLARLYYCNSINGTDSWEVYFVITWNLHIHIDVST